MGDVGSWVLAKSPNWGIIVKEKTKPMGGER